MAKVCKRCGIEVGVISSLFTFNNQKGRCKNCETATQQALIRFRENFLRMSNGTSSFSEEVQHLLEICINERVDTAEALQFVRPDALSLLDRILTAYISRSPLTDQVENYIRRLQRVLAVPDTAASSLLRRLYILNIYRGRFPAVNPWHLQDLRLESDETCHLVTAATFHRVNTSYTKLVPGRLVATNKKLRFLSPAGGAEIAWNSVMNVKNQVTTAQISKTTLPIVASGIYIELNKKSGNGFYSVADADVVVAIIDTLVRISKRQLVIMGADNSRHIPQEVKAAVWQRDQGKCVQCKANDYLEYDHIIPHSKGGASSINNVQLLCRRCNLAKSDRI